MMLPLIHPIQTFCTRADLRRQPGVRRIGARPGGAFGDITSRTATGSFRIQEIPAKFLSLPLAAAYGMVRRKAIRMRLRISPHLRCATPNEAVHYATPDFRPGSRRRVRNLGLCRAAAGAFSLESRTLWGAS